MQTFNSIYLGIVVQNNDPEHRGRVKVWVPHVSTTIYNKWNQLKQDQVFSFPGSPGGENLSAIIEDLKNVLPWAEYSSPIIGASSTGYYNNRFDVNTVSDAPLLFGQPGTSTTNTSSATNIDPENKGGNFLTDDKLVNFARTFIDYYEAKGWVVGKSPMKDWSSAVRNWMRSEWDKVKNQKQNTYAKH